jgi:transposase
MWQPRGKKGTITIKSNTGRKRITILGALNIGDLSITKTLVIVLDNARYNYAKATRTFAEENNILLLFLPPYAPNLNIIERLWKFSKKHLINNTYHKEFSKFFDATERFFNNLDEHHQELTSLLTQKFQIIHAE